MKFEKQTL